MTSSLLSPADLPADLKKWSLALIGVGFLTWGDWAYAVRSLDPSIVFWVGAIGVLLMLMGVVVGLFALSRWTVQTLYERRRRSS